MRILVTDGAWHIGSALARLAAARALDIAIAASKSLGSWQYPERMLHLTIAKTP